MSRSAEEPTNGKHLLGGRFPLEILAIFIGITASFWVEEWREERQDTETFHRLLGEIYFNVMMDEVAMANAAANNNLALTWASDLVIKHQPLPPPPVLFHQLQTIFSPTGIILNTGGLDRLTNTPLAIPVNDIQLALDGGYNILKIRAQSTVELGDVVRDIGRDAWWERGVIPCIDPLANLSSEPERLERLDLRGQAAPLGAAIGTADHCLTDSINEQAAVDAMASEAFRAALRMVISIRQAIARTLVQTRLLSDFLREKLVTYYPDIGLPVASVQILGSATAAGWSHGNAIELRHLGTTDWGSEVTLGEGAVKFIANRDWTINWGGKRPWIASGAASDGAYAASNVDPDTVFPTGQARLNGVNIPVRPGRYRIRFNTQDFEYRFERIDP